MEDRELLEHEIALKREHDERKRAVWDALEQESTMPGQDELVYFSNLLGEDLAHAEKVWPRLPAQVRRNLVLALNQVADDQVVMDFTAVFRIAIHDPDPEIRAAAVESLNEVEDVRLIAEFAELLLHDPDARVRQAAARTLANFVLLGELEKIREGHFHAAVSALWSSYTNTAEDRDVRRYAMESLAYTGEHNVPDMIAASYADADEAMRRSAIVAMGRSADKRWGDTVRRELQNPDPATRLEATRAIGELQLRAAAREIVDLVEDTDATIRTTALWSLGQMGGNLARKTLQRYTKAEDAILSRVAEQALQELEFFYGDLTSFFGHPSEYEGETEELWRMPGVADLSEKDDMLEDDAFFDEDDPDDDDDDDDELYTTSDEDDLEEDDEDASYSEEDDDDDLLIDLALIEALDDDDDDKDDAEEWR
jgi:HEAT repeat protein